MKRTGKKIRSVFGIISLLVAMSFMCNGQINKASASVDYRMDRIDTNVRSFLQSIGACVEIETKFPLNNCAGILEALYYPLPNDGYVIASYKDGHIIEYSPTDILNVSNLICSGEDIIYGGPNTFYQRNAGSFKDLLSEEEVFVDSDYYSLDFVENIPLTDVVSASDRIPQQRALYTLSAPTNYVIAAGGWFCTITGIANLLQYYKDFFSADTYAETTISVSGLRSYFNTHGYIYNGGLSLNDAANAHTRSSVTYSGLRSYLLRNDVTHYGVTVTNVSVMSPITLVSSYSRPSLLTINTSSISSGSTGTHIVLCYGYQQTASSSYYVVNNGWGSNFVLINTADVPSYYEVLYLHLPGEA